MSGPVFHSLSVCVGCGCSGEDFGSVNVEAFEVTGELYCEDCADEAIASTDPDGDLTAADLKAAIARALGPGDES